MVGSEGGVTLNWCKPVGYTYTLYITLVIIIGDAHECCVINLWYSCTGLGYGSQFTTTTLCNVNSCFSCYLHVHTICTLYLIQCSYFQLCKVNRLYANTWF